MDIKLNHTTPSSLNKGSVLYMLIQVQRHDESAGCETMKANQDIVVESHREMEWVCTYDSNFIKHPAEEGLRD